MVRKLAILAAFVLLAACGGGGGSSATGVGGGSSPVLSSSKSLISFSLAGLPGTIAEFPRTVSVPFPLETPNSSLGALVATFTTTGVAVLVDGKTQISGTTVNSFTSPVHYTIVAADNSTTDYLVTVAPSGVRIATGDMTSKRYDHSAILLGNGKVLTMGGNDGYVYLASCELYDPATGTWTATGNLASPARRPCAVLLTSGEVLMVDGSVSQRFAPASGTWSPPRPLVFYGRLFFTATLLPSGKVLVAGGTGGSGFNAPAELFDPATDTWSTTGTPSTMRSLATATLLSNGKVLVAGGDPGLALTSAELYDPSTGSWTPTGSLNKGRYGPLATRLPNGKVLLAGGILNGNPIPNTELYDPATGIWTPLGAMNQTHDYTETMVSLPSGNLLMVGRFTSELYDLGTGAWINLGGMATGGQLPAVTSLPNGKTLVTGGMPGALPGRNAELFW